MSKIKNRTLGKNGKKKLIFGFTLVELIVTITIIAILSTIAFMSFQGYNKSSRDSVRIADMNNIEKNLGIFVIEKGLYPLPDNGVNITYKGGTAWIQGTVGDTVTRNVGKMSKKPLDPLTNTEYTYSITNNKVEYQIGTILESGGAVSYLPLNQSYAAITKKAIARIKGNYNEKFLKVSTGSIEYILAVPTIITANLSDIDLITIISKNELVYNNYENLPETYKDKGYTMTGSFNFNPIDIVVYSGSSTDLTQNTSKIEFMQKLKDIYKGTILESNDNYQDIINSNPATNPNLAITLVNNYLQNNLGGITGEQSIVTYNKCTLDGQEINHNTTIKAYQEENILFGASYECTDKQQVRTCSDGTLSGEESYQYISCMKIGPVNCSANSNYPFNLHIYNIPAINHNATITNIESADVNENNGVFTYTLTSIGCYDGNLIDGAENPIPTLKNCNVNYTQSGNTCEINTYTVTFNGNGSTSGTMSNQTIATDATVNLTANTFVRTGYTFAGWATTAGGELAYANQASYTMGTSNVTLYAKWTPNNNTITFNANGGSLSMSNQIIATDATANLTTNAFVRTGYTFAGWATTAGGELAYANQASYTMGTSNVTLYAKWTPNINTITFNANGGTGTMSNQTIATAATANLTANAFVRTGYIFAGWATTAGGGVSYPNQASYTMGTSNVTLYAKWTFLSTILNCTSAGQLLTSTTTYGSCNTNDIIVCSGSGTGYIIASCNVGTNIAGFYSSSYGHHFQWGRNKGFTGTVIKQATTIAGTIGLNAGTDTYGFVWNSTLPSPYTWANTDITNNWGNTTNTNIARQGPCVSGYHVPSQTEWAGIVTAGGWGMQGGTMQIALKLPISGVRARSNGTMSNLTTGYYWSSTPVSNNGSYLYLNELNIFNSTLGRAYGMNVRCFKN